MGEWFTKILVNNKSDMEAKYLHSRHNCGQYKPCDSYWGYWGGGGGDIWLGGDSWITQCFLCGFCKHSAHSCLHVNESEAKEVKNLLMSSEEPQSHELFYSRGFWFSSSGPGLLRNSVWTSVTYHNFRYHWYGWKKNQLKLKTESSSSIYKFRDRQRVKTLQSVIINEKSPK